MAWYVIFQNEKPKHGYSPPCHFDGKASSPEVHRIAQHLANTKNRPMDIFSGKHLGRFWKTIYPQV